MRLRQPKVDHFELVNEQGTHRVEVYPGKEADCKNLPQTRSLSKIIYIGSNRVDHFENISYIAGEGTALTLLGTVTFNPDTNQI